MTVGDTPPRQIVGRQLDGDPIAGEHPDVVRAHLPGQVTEHRVTVLQLHGKHRVWQRVDDPAINRDRIGVCPPWPLLAGVSRSRGGTGRFSVLWFLRQRTCSSTSTTTIWHAERSLAPEGPDRDHHHAWTMALLYAIRRTVPTVHARRSPVHTRRQPNRPAATTISASRGPVTDCAGAVRSNLRRPNRPPPPTGRTDRDGRQRRTSRRPAPR